MTDDKQATQSGMFIVTMEYKPFWGNAKSDVWKHFHFETENGHYKDKALAVCMHCCAQIRFCGSTTSMSNHLDRKHFTLRHGHGENTISRLPTMPKTLDMTASVVGRKLRPDHSHNRWDFDHLQAKKANVLVARYLYKGLKPLNTVNSQSFRDMIEAVNPHYQLPHSDYILQNMIIPVYHQVKTKIEQEMKEAERHCLTSDLWNSMANEGYLTATVHFITAEWDMRTYNLQTRSVTESHTGEVIADELAKVDKEWKLKEPIAVTDSSSNIKMAVQNILTWLNIPCIGHSLNTAVKRGLFLDEVKVVVCKAREIIKFILRREVAVKVLEVKQKLLDLPQNELLLDVDTRWNSTLDMLECFVAQWDAIYAVIIGSYIKEKERLPLPDDIVVLTKLITILKAFKTITKSMSSEKQPTASLMLPALHKLKTAMEIKESDTDIEKRIKHAISADMNSKYTEPDVLEFLPKASALDPRTKTLSFLPSPHRDAVFESLKCEALTLTAVVKQELTDDMPRHQHVQGDGSFPTADQSGIGDDHGPGPTKKRKEDEEEDWLSDVMDEAVYSPADQIDNEFQRYQAEPLLPQKANPLAWWKKRSETYPHICKLAKRYLCVVATSVPSERIFSDAGNIMNAKRSCLDADTVDMLIFLHMNA